MNESRILTDAEVKHLIPQGAIDAMNCDDESQLKYCEECDGMRLKGHFCAHAPVAHEKTVQE